MTRVPHADQPEIAAEFCACPKPEDADPRTRALATLLYGSLKNLRIVNPDCPLHGDNTERSPF